MIQDETLKIYLVMKCYEIQSSKDRILFTIEIESILTSDIGGVGGEMGCGGIMLRCSIKFKP